MAKTVPEQRREINHREEPSRDRELAVILWVLASLIAEVELWSWVFARIYGA